MPAIELAGEERDADVGSLPAIRPSETSHARVGSELQSRAAAEFNA